ncbi:unnamed protein product [Spirodela intermedia]|uniref:Uncharacterized protein n=1 Tax=Spirodela intermedia TaxID=51605 RepID=A0A7I8J3I3_SPIIN|nr:unnamed protein product [Spirodela intermedia]CAA6664659.1 unnamed protein product [Spirodela intermedia]
MAPLPHPPAAKETTDGRPPLPIGDCLISSALRHIPMPSSAARRRPAKPPLAALVGELWGLHAAMAAALERSCRAVAAAVVGDGLLATVLRIPAEFQRFCQVNCRSSASPSSLSAQGFAAVLQRHHNFLNIYNTLLVVRLVLTWFPNAPPAVVAPLSTLCDPYLNIFRGIIPPVGGLDLSPILAFLVLNAFQSTAAALPVELPSAGGVSCSAAAAPPMSLTTMQEKWVRRICRRRAKSDGAGEQATGQD